MVAASLKKKCVAYTGHTFFMFVFSLIALFDNGLDKQVGLVYAIISFLIIMIHFRYEVFRKTGTFISIIIGLSIAGSSLAYLLYKLS